MFEQLHKNKKMLLRLLLVCVVILFYLLIYHVWLLSFNIITSGDWGYNSPQELDYFRLSYFSIWLSDYSLGRILVDLGQAPSYVLYGVFNHFLSFPYSVSERIVHFYPTIFIAPIASYLLVKRIVPSKVAAVLGAIVYSFNTYFLTLQTGHLTLAAAYAIAPLSVLLFINFISQRSILKFVLLVVTLSIHTAYEPRSMYIILFVLMFYTIAKLIDTYVKTRNFKEVLKLSFFCLAPIVYLALINFYWLYALSHAGSGVGTNVIENSLFGDTYFNMAQAITLFHPYWSGGKVIPFVVNSIPYQDYLIPIAAILGFYFNRKNKKILFFTFIGLIGIFLTKQSGQPFTDTYNWLFHHLPGFNAYREASKFYILTALSYSILISSLYLWIKNHFKKRFVATCYFIVLSLVFLLNTIPLITGIAGTTFVSRSVPQQYNQLNKFLDQPNYFRTYWLPERSRWGLDSKNHPYIDGSTIVSTTWKSLFQDDSTVNNPATSTKVLAPFIQNYGQNLLSSASVKYVIVPLVDTANDDNFYNTTASDQSIYLTTLRKTPWLKEINLNINKIHVFENMSFQPYITTFNNLYTIQGSSKLPQIDDYLRTVLSLNDYNYTQNSKFVFSNSLRFPFDNSGNNIDRAINNDQKSYVRSPSKLSYTLAGSNLTVIKDSNPYIDGKNAPITTSTVYSSDNTLNNFYLTDGNKLLQAQQGTYQYSDTSSKNTVFNSNDLNLLPNTDSSLWNTNGDLCNQAQGNIRQNSALTYDPTLLKKVVKLVPTSKKTSCVGTNLDDLEPGDYALSFQYKVDDGQFASYSIRLNDDPINEYNIISGDDSWHTYSKLVHIDTTSNVYIQLNGKPSDQLDQNPIQYYSNVSINKLNQVASIPSESNNFFQTQSLDKPTLNSDVSKNLIENADLKSGLWSKTVSDCHDYDNHPDIGMNLVPQGSGGNALELRAKRHVACTTTPTITTNTNTYYTVKFDLKSPNSTYALFRINFYGSNASPISQTIPIKNSNWSTYSYTFKTPIDSSQLSITFFSLPDFAGDGNYINLYKNFSLHEDYPMANNVITDEGSKNNYVQPKSVSFINRNNTEKDVTIRGATSSFFLRFGETYDPGWSLQYADKDYQSDVNRHFEVNSSVNGWFISLSNCTSSGLCHKNEDGSYDINLKIYFQPEKYLNIGLIISMVSIIILFIVFIIGVYKKRRVHRHA